MNAAASPKTVVLIHGLWMTPLSWENWQARFESRGYRVIAPAWPGMAGDIDELRRDTSGIDRLTVTEILASYEEVIRDLDSPPIIMGHSFGGAFTEILLDRGLGAAGVGIDAAAIKGVLKLPFSTLKSGWPILRNPLNRHKAVALTPKQFHYSFGNALSEEESRKVWERYAIPGPGGVLFAGAMTNLPGTALKVDYDKPDRAPLLLIAGGVDHIVPAAVTRSQAKLYRKSKSPATVEYKEFPGRSHYTVGQDGWEEVADYALDWAETNTA
ncbi:MAG TPA: alpha/beta hydrolase [Gaiellaceae bacterium]|nr:alpha/beta hydrolase [Gaiellaceae bacterium]